MKLCRFLSPQGGVRVGLVQEDSIVDLTSEEFPTLSSILEAGEGILSRIEEMAAGGQGPRPRFPRKGIRILPPVDRQEVWAAGVTYIRSKKARMEESDFSASAYDLVYEAPRPELFFKSPAEKVVGDGDSVGIRRDSKWNVPEPELTLVCNSRGQIAAYTIGNDMSSRDIEGENLLYLPQAKIYCRSCALGPWLVLGKEEAIVRTWTISLTIRRKGEIVFQGQTSIDKMRRSFEELTRYLFRSQHFPQGVLLLTGTGIVPPNDFSLLPGDSTTIEISGIGTLTNEVIEV